MTDKQIFFYTLIASSVIHVAVIGTMGGLFSVPSSEPMLRAQAVKIDSKKTPLLPEIKVMGEFKQFPKVSSSKPQDTSFNKEAFTQEIGDIEPESMQAEDEAEKAMLRYQDMVKQRIESYRYYPLRAQRMRIEGVVDLAFVINADGSSENVRIIKSSGSKFLDTEAVKTIRKASPFLPLPEEIKRTNVDIRVAIVFSLD